MIMLSLLFAPQAIEFALKRAPADSITYSATASLTVDGQAVTVTSKITEMIRAVKSDGYTLSVDVTRSMVKFGQQTNPQPNVHTERSYTTLGKVEKIMGDQVDSLAYRRDFSLAFIYPGKSLKVGDRWTSAVDAKAFADVPASVAKFQLESVDKQVAHVISDFTEIGISKPMKTHVEFWVDVTTGKVTRKKAKITNLPITPETNPIAATIEYVMDK